MKAILTKEEINTEGFDFIEWIKKTNFDLQCEVKHFIDNEGNFHIWQNGNDTD